MTTLNQDHDHDHETPDNNDSDSRQERVVTFLNPNTFEDFESRREVLGLSRAAFAKMLIMQALRHVPKDGPGWKE